MIDNAVYINKSAYFYYYSIDIKKIVIMTSKLSIIILMQCLISKVNCEKKSISSPLWYRSTVTDWKCDGCGFDSHSGAWVIIDFVALITQQSVS